SIPELIAVLIPSPRLSEIQRDRLDIQIREGVQFPRFGYTVVIGVLPQTQGSKCSVVSVNHAVGIATVGPLIVLSQRKKTVARDSVRWVRLWREIAKEFTTVIDYAVAIAVQHEEGVIRPIRCPC